MSALEQLLDLPDRNNNPYVQEWKQKGGRVVGFACGYVPEEIIHATGLLPYRVEAREVSDTGLADVYMHRFNCTFARCILQAGLSDEYKFLDGFALLNGCEQIRRIYEIWEKHVQTGYQYMITIPHTITEAGLEWYQEEITNFKEALSHNFGQRCNNDDLAKSIEVYNTSRRLISELYELRKDDAPSINGAESLGILLAAGAMPRELFNELLGQALDEIKERPGISDYSARLMLGGSALDDPMLIKVIEEMGGLVVTDSLCFGAKHFMHEVEEDGDPLSAIAKRYYTHDPCPRMLNEFDNRSAATMELAKGAGVDGVILQKIVFCDNHAVDATMLANELEEQDMPTLILEREHMLSDLGRLKTRVEAFIERIARR